MKRSSIGLLVIASTCLSICSPGALVLAADVPETLCVTAKTQDMHVAAEARLKKDIAPYTSSTGALAAITLYRQELDNAWSAMLQPYCGFGKYGTASAVKSYQKSIDRARSAFISADKIHGGAVVTSTMVEPVIPALIVSASEKPKTATTHAQLVVRKRIPRGLTIGMQSDEVAELQRRLCDHFGLKGSERRVTGFFGKITRGLVVKFQIEKKFITGGDDEAAGIIGPRTVAALNVLE
jgi:hypothetical protein